jgi:hypothetical protein
LRKEVVKTLIWSEWTVETKDRLNWGVTPVSSGFGHTRGGKVLGIVGVGVCEGVSEGVRVGVRVQVAVGVSVGVKVAVVVGVRVFV